MKLSRLDGPFGWAAEDVDYYSEDDAIIVRSKIAKDRLVVLKNQEPVPAEKLVNFYKLIGDVVAQTKEVVGSGVDGHQELVRVRRNGLFTGDEDGELEWHCAGMNRNGAENIVAMYMHMSSFHGGDTWFSDAKTAYEEFPEKEELDEVISKTVNYPEKMLVGNTHYKNVFADEKTYKAFKDIDGVPAHTKQTNRKKLVTLHPLTQEKGLHFPWSVIRGFHGMDKKKSHALYYKLKEHTMSDKYVYKHKWDMYDACLSDQEHSLHRRDSYDGDRELWRAGIWYRPEGAVAA